MKRILIMGCGYVGTRVALTCIARGIEVLATVRTDEHARALQQFGITSLRADSPLEISRAALDACDAILDSIPLMYSDGIASAPQCAWLPTLTPRIQHVQWTGYLSSTSVYGDAHGAWVDESYPCKPGSERGCQRLLAEQAWLDTGLPVEVFRLAGIYGPGRNIIPKLLQGDYPVIAWDTSHWSNRVHVDDIVRTIFAAMDKPCPDRVLNVCDDMPLSHADYATELALAIGAPMPVRFSLEEAKVRLSPVMLEFFSDNKRLSNHRLHTELLPQLRYPSFRDALPELIAAYSYPHSASQQQW